MQAEHPEPTDRGEIASADGDGSNPSSSEPARAAENPLRSDALRSPSHVDELLLYRLALAVRFGNALSTRVLEGWGGITRREWGVLTRLDRLAHDITPSELADELKLDRTRTSRALQALLGKGLVDRTRADADRRLVRVRLSARGKQIVDKVFPRIAELNRELASALTPGELATFADCLSRLEARARQLVGTDWASVKADRRRGGTRRHGVALP